MKHQRPLSIECNLRMWAQLTKVTVIYVTPIDLILARLPWPAAGTFSGRTQAPRRRKLPKITEVEAYSPFTVAQSIQMIT